MIDGVPNCLFGVSYEDTFLIFGFELIRLKPFDISVATQTLRNDSLGFLTNHSSYGVVSMDLDGALFNVSAVVTTKKDTSMTFWAERIFFLSYL